MLSKAFNSIFRAFSRNGLFSTLYLSMGPFSTKFSGNFIGLWELLLTIRLVILCNVLSWKIAGKKNGIPWTWWFQQPRSPFELSSFAVMPESAWTSVSTFSLSSPAKSQPWFWCFLSVFSKGSQNCPEIFLPTWTSYMTFCIFPPEQLAWWEALVICKQGSNQAIDLLALQSMFVLWMNIYV